MNKRASKIKQPVIQTTTQFTMNSSDLQPSIVSIEATPVPDEYEANAARLKRNRLGLIDGIAHKFTPEGFVDWRKMILSEELYPNKDFFAKSGEPIPSDLTSLEDHKLCIKLGGIKRLARLRGYSRVVFEVLESSAERAVVKCNILWNGNYENPYNVEFESVANATLDNCDSFTVKFLESIAENRAFVRCVRNFLGINIVGFDEIDKNKTAVVTKNNGPVMSLENLSPNVLLANRFSSNFDNFKGWLRELWVSDAYKNSAVTEWSDFGDIPKAECMKLLGLHRGA